MHTVERYFTNGGQMEITDSIAEAVSLNGIEAMEQFFHAIHMTVTMKELGIEPLEEQIAEMAR